MLTQAVTQLQVGQLQTNCYIWKIDDTNALIIDPGDDGEYITQKLMDADLTPVAIFATHGHFDHVLAGFTLQAAYSIPFYLHKSDEFLLKRMRNTAIHFGEVDPGPPPIAQLFEDKSTIHIPSIQFEILPVPGHTPGGVCYYHPQQEIIFVGDLVDGNGSLGETSHLYSDKNAIKKSLQKILSLPESTMCYPGHGEALTIEELRDKCKWALI